MLQVVGFIDVLLRSGPALRVPDKFDESTLRRLVRVLDQRDGVLSLPPGPDAAYPGTRHNRVGPPKLAVCLGGSWR